MTSYQKKGRRGGGARKCMNSYDWHVNLFVSLMNLIVDKRMTLLSAKERDGFP